MSKMPVLFIGHGSPMNAIEDNAYTRALRSLGPKLPKPKAILVVSAHWTTETTKVMAAAKPKTIHDFYGFPKPLFEIQYPAPGAPDVASEIRTQIKNVTLDADSWGLDHGAWAVLVHLYPKADIPVLQLSLDIHAPGNVHLELGSKLQFLRSQGVLIIGSGNVVHNLGAITWSDRTNALPWCQEFDNWTKESLEKRDFNSLAQDFLKTDSGKMSHPTIEHYLPLLYTVGASDPEDELKFIYEGLEYGSLSMRSFGFF